MELDRDVGSWSTTLIAYDTISTASTPNPSPIIGRSTYGKTHTFATWWGDKDLFDEALDNPPRAVYISCVGKGACSDKGERR